MKSADYLDEKKIASQRYSSIKSRVKRRATKLKSEVKIEDGYDLEEYWERADFIKWYIDEKKECCYCKTSSAALREFYDMNNSKRKSTRGATLEIERVKDTKYSRDNCKLCCYWCNNAKSDVFSSDEFTNIGIAIGVVIKEKLREKLTLLSRAKRFANDILSFLRILK